MKKEYDMAFGLGFSCGTSEALRGASLQFASYPLDWTAEHDISVGVNIVGSEFRDWFNADDLELFNVSHAVGFMTRFYLNRRTQIGFTHEFSDFEPFEATYPRVKMMYERRIARFLAEFRSASRALAVWMEPPTHEHIDEEGCRNALAMLRDKRHGAVMDLVAFYEEPGLAEPRVVVDDLGLTIVAADYRKMVEGKIAHYVDVSQICKFLADRVSVPDRRTEEEKAAFVAAGRRQHEYRWGPERSWFRRWVNQRAYKLYRHLERVLRKKGFVQGDVSLWFWDDLRREAERGAE